MTPVYVVTTSYPTYPGDAQGHFVAAEVRRLTQTHDVTVLAPGRARCPLGNERVISLGGGDAFGFPGALARVRERPWRAVGASAFVVSALRWLKTERAPARLIAHFLLPCAVPIATRGLGKRRTELEVVVHGSDARLLAKLPAKARAFVGQELAQADARLRFVSSELQDLVLGSLPTTERNVLQTHGRVEPCAIDLPGAQSRSQARQALGIAPAGRVAVIVARLVASKRVHVALEACERLPHLQTIVLGEGPERDRLSRRFPHATFVGQIDRPLALTYLTAADALVSASLQEGAPTAVREARALGTPVICLPAGDLTHWAAHDPALHVVNDLAPALRVLLPPDLS